MLSRWKQHFRKFTSILLTTAMTITTTGVYPVQTLAATEEATGIYVSEVMAYQGTLEDAQAKFPDYIFVEEDISKDGGSGKTTYLGYKTTDDVTLALRDIATLQMGGNYKMGDYKTLMTEKEQEIQGLVYEFQIAANEYKENYEAGKERALNAYELLNKYYEEDTGLKMGDFLLADESKVTYENYQTLFMQSNSTTLNALKKILLTAVDTKEDTWVDRLAETKDFAGLLEKENAKRKANGEAALSSKAAKTYYENLYQDKMKYFESGWEALRTGLNQYMEAGISVNDDEIVDYMEDLNEAEGNITAEDFAIYGSIYEILEKIPYEEDTMVDFFLQPFEEADELQLFVLLDAMSEAQCELGSDLGLAQMFLTIAQQSMEEEKEESILAVSDEEKEFVEEKMTEMREDMAQNLDGMIDTIKQLESLDVVEKETVEDDSISVYAGVDRDYFKGSFGMTSDGQKQQLSSETPWYNSTGIVISSYIAGVIGVSLTAYGIYNLVASARSFTSDMGKITEKLDILRGKAKFFEENLNEVTEKWNVINEQVEIINNAKGLTQLQKIEQKMELQGAIEFYQNEIEIYQSETANNIAQIEKWESAESMVKNRASAAKIFGTTLLVIGIAMTAYSLTVNILRLMDDDNPGYAEIPEKMVDTSKSDDPVQPYLYYNVVRDQNGKAADINSYSSGTWLALYTTRSYDAGLPILAKDFASIRRGDVGSDTLNMGFAHEFGAKDPENLLGYSKNAQDADATYLLYNHGDAPLAGSTFGGNNAMALALLAGLAIAGGAVLFYFRKKEEQAV